MTSYRVQVVADSSGEWVGNAMRYRSHDEADNAGKDLLCRWLLAQRYRVVPSDDQPNTDGKGNYVRPEPPEPDPRTMLTVW